MEYQLDWNQKMEKMEESTKWLVYCTDPNHLLHKTSMQSLATTHILRYQQKEGPFNMRSMGKMIQGGQQHMVNEMKWNETPKPPCYEMTYHCHCVGDVVPFHGCSHVNVVLEDPNSMNSALPPINLYAYMTLMDMHINKYIIQGIKLQYPSPPSHVPHGHLCSI